MNGASVAIRDALLGEAGALEDLQLRASLVWEEYRADLEAHPDAIEVAEADIAAGNVRVAADSERVVGFSVLQPGGDGAAELDGLFVEPAVMRRGIGRALIDDAVRLASSRGCTGIEVTANPRALGFYVKLGFVDAGVVQTRFGAGLRMRKELGQGPH